MKEILFSSQGWLVWLMPFIGILAAGLTKRTDPHIDRKNGRVFRHDRAAIVEHWTHGIGTFALIVTGIMMGFLVFPALVDASGVRLMMNIHFVFVCIFLFGTFYYGANALLSVVRFKEHFPTKDAVGYTVQHYGLLLGSKKCKMPPERKYFESEKVAFVFGILATLVIIISGFLKVFAHSFNISPAVMGIVTPAHDIATIAMVLFFIPHVFFAVILPASWPIAKSMFTGWVPLEYAQSEHAGWISKLEAEEAQMKNVSNKENAPESEISKGVIDAAR